MIIFRSISTFSLAAALASAPAMATAQNSSEETTEVTDTTPTSPPRAEKREHSYTHHGITISDPYDWLYDKSYPVVDDEDVLVLWQLSPWQDWS